MCLKANARIWIFFYIIFPSGEGDRSHIMAGYLHLLDQFQSPLITKKSVTTRVLVFGPQNLIFKLFLPKITSKCHNNLHKPHNNPNKPQNNSKKIII